MARLMRRENGTCPAAKSVAAEFYVPVGEVEEVAPAVIHRFDKRYLDEGTPMRLLRSANHVHVSLLWGTIALSPIAVHTTAHDILPGSVAPLVLGHNMI